MSLSRARELRSTAPVAERKLWAILHSFRQQGYHFRRQVPIGPYYADIASHDARLVIEADGATHSSEAELAHDRRRDEYIRSHGFKILRVWNSDIMNNADGVLRAVADALEGTAPLKPSPPARLSHLPRRRKLRTGLSELASRTGATAPSPPSPLRGGAGGGGHDHNSGDDT